MIYDAFPDSLVEVCTFNEDAGMDWLEPYRSEHNLHLPIMHHASAAFRRFKLGREFHCLPPLYIVIDKRGVVRHRSWAQGSIAVADVARLVEQLLREQP